MVSLTILIVLGMNFHWVLAFHILAGPPYCQIQKDFIWDSKRAKIKHDTLIADYPDGGLKDIDIKAKIDSLQAKKTPKKKAQDKDPMDLTEADLEELLNPGVHIYPFKPKKKEDKNDKDPK